MDVEVFAAVRARQRAGYVLADAPGDLSGHIRGAVYLMKINPRRG